MRRYTEAEIMAAIVQSFFTAFVKTEGDTTEMPFSEPSSEDAVEVSRDPSDYEMGPGNTIIMEPGEDVAFGSPTHPNTGFDTFMRALCEQVGAAFEIPADLLLMSFNASYSASRAALLEAWKAFRMRREWLTKSFCRPVYEVWMTEAVARGRIIAPGFLTDPLIRQAYLQSEWIGPSQGQLDPTKEVAAAVTAIENGLSTREAEAIRLNGSEYAANVDKLTMENERLRKANGAANQTFAKPQAESQEEETEEDPEESSEDEEQEEKETEKEE
jgi:lambda family phage portal protein